MTKYRKNQKTASMARSRVDKAQNNLLKGLKKKVDALEADIESKYGYQVISDLMESYDGTTVSGRQLQIYSIDIGENQGTGDNNQRIGDQVTLKHIDLHYRIHLIKPRTTEFVPEQVTSRVMMFWDNQPSTVSTAGVVGVNPVYWPQVLQLCDVDTVATTDDMKQLIMMSEKDWDQRKRFSIIYDKTHTLSSNLNSIPSTISTGGNGPRSTTSCVSFSKNYKGQRIRYVNSGQLPQNRRLYYAFLSDVGNTTGGVSASRPSMHLQTRVIYDDA